MSRWRRPSPAEWATLLQLVLAAALAVALGVALWRFLAIAERLPGGAARYVYVPIALGAAAVLAVARVVGAARKLRARPAPGAPMALGDRDLGRSSSADSNQLTRS